MNINNIPTNLPSPLQEEFKRLQTIDTDSYGLVFAVRDLYETALKVICLSVCYLMEQDGDDCFCKVLFSPKQMAFGNWLNDLPNEINKSAYMKNHVDLQKYLKRMVGLYNSTKIVTWRNNFIGHGLMANPDDAAFFVEVEDKINCLIQFFTDKPVPGDIMSLDFEHLEPFMFREATGYYLYESALSNGSVLYTNQTSRRRILRQVSYVLEKSKKYFDKLNIMQHEQVWNQDVYLSDEDKAIDGFHLTPYYKKPEYMLNWLKQCIANNSGGIFLMQGGRGTGKSSFVLACDELNQHGNQKISVIDDKTDISVRAYYCSRIDFSNINDFRSYVEDILAQLKDGNRIKSRSGSHACVSQGLSALLQFYQEQYVTFLGRDKLLFFIDGIDELTSKGWDILSLLPHDGDVPDDVYIVLTSRTEMEEVPPLIQDFIRNHSFTDQVSFDLRAENHQFFSTILEEEFHITSSVSSRIAAAFDDRLSVIPLLLTLSKDELQHIGTAAVPTNSLDTLAEMYLARIKLRYGSRYYKDFIRFLMTISEARELLSLNEISLLSADHETTTRELCFLKDAAPFMTEYRSYRGNLYGLSRMEYKDLLRKTYKQEFVELLLEWQNQLIQFKTNEPLFLSETYRDVLLYLCGCLGELQEEYDLQMKLEAEDSSENGGLILLQTIYQFRSQTGVSDQLHRTRRALRGLLSTELSLEILVQAGRCSDSDIMLLLECASDIIERAVTLREMALSEELIKRLSALIDENHLTAHNCAQRLCFAKFYARSMIHYCEIYDVQQAECYFNKAIAALGNASDYGTLRSSYEQVQDALWHNYLGVYRNCDPAKTLSLGETFLKNIQEQELSFSKVNNYLMAAMCCKSASQTQQCETLLCDACDMMETILEKRQMSYTDITNPHEQEIYMNIYWRLAQIANEKCKTNLDEVSFTELKLFIQILDNFIHAVILASMDGFGHFDFLRIDMMTTAALLRNTIAYKLAHSWLNRPSFSAAAMKGISDYKAEALQAASIVEQAYANLDKVGVVYNKINAMVNLMNCACVYSGFGENDAAIQKLKRILQEFHPENAQEQRVYWMVRGKLEEVIRRR